MGVSNQTNDISIVEIKHQSQTSTPTTGDNTLVDDTVSLVDDLTALVGGPNTPIENNPVAIDSKPPKMVIKRYR